jgi:hypothetical protein
MTPMAAELAVVVEVEQPDGTPGFVRVGTARRDGAFFVLDLGALRLSPLEPEAVLPAPVPPPATSGTLEDLEYIAARARRTLGDASKARWHTQERALLQEVEAELARCRDAGKKSA